MKKPKNIYDACKKSIDFRFLIFEHNKLNLDLLPQLRIKFLPSLYVVVVLLKIFFFQFKFQTDLKLRQTCISIKMVQQEERKKLEIGTVSSYRFHSLLDSF